MKKIKKLSFLIPVITLPIIVAPVVVSCSSTDNPFIDSATIAIKNSDIFAGDNVTLTSDVNITSATPGNIRYRWECKEVNEEWVTYSTSSKELTINQIPITLNNSIFRLVVSYKNKNIFSNELTLNVKPVKAIESINVISEKPNYSVGEKLIIHAEPKTLDYAIDNISAIEYEWEQQLPGTNTWTKLNSIGNGSVLEKTIDNFAESKSKFRVIGKYNGFSTTSNIINLNKIIPLIKENNEYTKDQIQDDGLYCIGVNDMDIVSQNERLINNQYYETELWTKYHQDYGFIYPGWNRDYEYQDQRYFFNAEGQRIDAKELVFNERVTDSAGNYVLDGNGNQIKYNNAEWIKNEISNGTLKKHHAADNFFRNEYQYAPETVMHYDISTSVTGPITLGLFAPPGEVITFEFDDETWEIFKRENFWGLDVVINENFWDNRNSNDSGGISNRYPFLESVFTIDPNSKTLKVGTPFGGGLSLRIRQSIVTSSGIPNINDCNQNIKFTVSGAIKCMFYQYGVTTPNEWEQQKELLKQNQLAPILQAMGPYFALTIPATNLNEIGHTYVDELKFPKKLFKKWSDFLYLSNYYASNDIRRDLFRLNMEFCDDIWGGAVAWGGNKNLYCSSSLGSKVMFTAEPDEVFNSSNSWALFHEINHNFQQNEAFFNDRSHPETNQVTGFNLSVISDVGRFRKEINWTGEKGYDNSFNTWYWTKLNNSFTTINSVVSQGSYVGEYPIYSILLFLMGSKNYVDYVREDMVNDPCNSPNWTGLKEIQRISDTLKLNLWPAFENYGVYWRDNWPVSTETATPEQLQIINQLKTYPATDFVGNLYATGVYLYDYLTQTYNYTGDVISPFEIPAFNPYTFKFDEFINSTNRNFTWNSIKLDSNKTKLGGSVQIDPNNPKNVIYTPNLNKVTEIDEFDVSIIPGQWTNKPTNYVPAIKFKIKVRQVVNGPVLESFDAFANQNLTMNQLFDELKRNQKFRYRNSLATFKNPGMFLGSNGIKSGVKIKYRFVAPEAGHYSFENLWDDCIRIYVNNQPNPVFSNDVYNINNWTQTYSADLQKNQIVDFEFLVINTDGLGDFNSRVKLNGQLIDIFSNCLIPNTNYVPSLNINEIFNTKKQDYQYKTRLIDRTIFNGDLSSSVNFSNYTIDVYPTNKYTLESKYQGVNNLNNYETGYYFEHWNNDYAPGQAFVSFDVYPKFNTPISSFYFGHRTNNHPNARPTNIKVIGYQNNDLAHPITMYDGIYGAQFNDRSSSVSILNLNDTYSNITKIHIELINTLYYGLILHWFRMSPNVYVSQGPSIGFNNSAINVNGNWIFKNNDDLNVSAINNLYSVSNNINDTIEFTLLNSKGFNIIGQNNPNLANFDVYINDQKVNNNITASPTIKYNQVLFSYIISQSQTLRVRIVHKDTKPLYLNYLMTYGEDCSIIKNR